MSEFVATGAAESAYARLSRRLQAVVIDSVIRTLLMVAPLVAAVSVSTDHVDRVLGVAVWILYEPLLVSLTGGTIGHWRTDLRVVDSRSHGNIGFAKAVLRAAVKAVLGIYSFVTMAMSSRHQAVHDLVTGSTVQVPDLSRARRRDYVTAPTELLNPAMPSAGGASPSSSPGSPASGCSSWSRRPACWRAGRYRRDASRPAAVRDLRERPPVGPWHRLRRPAPRVHRPGPGAAARRPRRRGAA